MTTNLQYLFRLWLLSVLHVSMLYFSINICIRTLYPASVLEPAVVVPPAAGVGSAVTAVHIVCS